MKHAIIYFLLGYVMNGTFTLGPEQYSDPTQSPSIEIAQIDRTEDAEGNKPVISTEDKKRESEPAKPKKATRESDASPKNFVPTEKIPADQAVDFPTDI